MLQLIKKRLNSFPVKPETWELLKAFEFAFENQCLTSAALAGAAVATPSTGAPITAMVGGQLVYKATGTAMPALTGQTLAIGAWNIYIFTMDAAGNLYTLPGTPGATPGAVVFPTVYEYAPNQLPQVVIGSLVVNTTSSTFIPGTTLLNAAGVTPIFNNTVGPFYPTQIL